MIPLSTIMPPLTWGQFEEILFGSLLGDGSLEFMGRSKNARFTLSQGKVHSQYFFYLLNLFTSCEVIGTGLRVNFSESHVKHNIKLSTFSYDYLDSRTNKLYTTLSFKSNSLEYFTRLHALFYSIPVGGGNYKKYLETYHYSPPWPLLI